MYTKNVINIILLFIVTSCNVKNKVNYDPIKDIPNKITNRYGTDIVINDKMATSIAEIIFKEHDKYNSFEDYKPFSCKLVSDGKIWEIIAKPISNQTKMARKKYYLRLNKNTGEVLNFWVEK